MRPGAGRGGEPEAKEAEYEEEGKEGEKKEEGKQ